MRQNKNKFSYYHDNNVANAMQIIIINHNFKNQKSKIKNQTNDNFKNYFSINLQGKMESKLFQPLPLERILFQIYKSSIVSQTDILCVIPKFSTSEILSINNLGRITSKSE